MLSNEIIEAVEFQAELIGLDKAALLAIVDIESGGVPFWNIAGVNKPVIRFEGHYFYARLTGNARKKAVQAGLASPKVGGVPNPTSGQQRYAMLERAMAINEDAALESVSWGLGQVMGANWKDLGRSSVKELVQDSQTLSGQLDLMTDFIEFKGLDKFIRTKDWKSFAKGYNGANYSKNKYDTKLATAYKAYSKKDVEDVKQDEILLVQKMLNKVVSSKLKEDGELGPATIAAIKDFQISQGLTVDGKYGPITRDKLIAVYKEKNTNTQRKVGATTTATGVAVSVITEATKSIQPLSETSQIAQYIFIGLIGIGVILTLKTIFWPSN